MMNHIDGHFWVERDGQIIDPDFSEEESTRIKNKLRNEKTYHEAPELVQKVFLAIAEKTVDSELRKKKLMGGNHKMSITVSEYARLFVPMLPEERDEALAEYTPKYLSCGLNAYKEMKQNGGRLVFGSRGYAKKNGKGVWWQYGHPTLETVSSFTSRCV
jgi:hypothetical protein